MELRLIVIPRGIDLLMYENNTFPPLITIPIILDRWNTNLKLIQPKILFKEPTIMIIIKGLEVLQEESA